ncbi:putative copper homeostasis protein cutC like protein [Daphnia sinensis]|uniref:Copper homeostasis protein cutC homolog n=1 Tax=Daphnia sinensis TaxID=1820382 RepID=A0AAD5PKY9_9CRUS|nr:putative copper homeostasis protein cutC like protein [Daphnia sinensis]
MSKIVFEAPVFNLEASLEAAKFGINRLELCANFPEGGETPSAGMVKFLKEEIDIPVFKELMVMKQDIELLAEHGADGFVFGILDNQGKVNIDACEILLRSAANKPCTFHRAFDASFDLFDSMDRIIDAGFTRILTSGGKNTATEGLETLRELIEKAQDRISIMPGGGTKPEHVSFLKQTGYLRDIHASCKTWKPSQNQFVRPGLSFSDDPKSFTHHLGVDQNLVLNYLVIACNPISERKQPPPTLEQLASTDLKLNGDRLAEAYCGSCHLMPKPEVLDRNTWKTKVLPDMRKRMGLYLEEDFGTELPEDSGVPPGIYSKAQLIKREDWAKIEEFYLENSPEKPIPQIAKKSPKFGFPGFTVEQPAFTKNQRFYFHRCCAVEIRWDSDQSFELLTMGLMDPSKDSVGALSRYWKESKIWKKELILDKLIRPVHAERADWDGDGKLDRVISSFGDHLGKLSFFAGSNAGELILKPNPGARRTMAVDFDRDGKLDMIGLMAQAQEGIYVWINQGGGKFLEKAFVRFHPAFGSSDFRYEDINGDGHLDLILVNGNNADLSQILKSYHGVRVFLNDGDGKFEENWFYPLHGASGIEVGDFDQDGDMDLVVLSFFPDPNQRPRQDLMYFRQDSSGDFEPFVIQENIDSHWLTMTKGDLDLDGDQDLVIGTFEFDDLYKKPTKPWRPFIILRNSLK